MHAALKLSRNSALVPLQINILPPCMPYGAYAEEKQPCKLPDRDMAIGNQMPNSDAVNGATAQAPKSKEHRSCPSLYEPGPYTRTGLRGAVSAI